MQVSQISSTNFQAHILPSRALTSALELAQSEARIGTKEGVKRASQFYNNLRTIEKDQNTATFFIDSNPQKLYPYMRLGNVTRLLEFFKYKENLLPNAVIDGVNKLVESKYLMSERANEAKDVDLTKAFNKWAKV